jgi:hypothetical protein
MIKRVIGFSLGSIHRVRVSWWLGFHVSWELGLTNGWLTFNFVKGELGVHVLGSGNVSWEFT